MDYSEILKKIESKSERAFLIDRMIENAFRAASKEEGGQDAGGIQWVLSWLLQEVMDQDGAFSANSASDYIKGALNYVTEEYNRIGEGVADGSITASHFDLSSHAVN